MMSYQAEATIDPEWRAATLRQAGPWIRKCLETHKDCKPRGHEKTLPTRVIDVGPSDGSENPRLYVHVRSTGESQETQFGRQRSGELLEAFGFAQGKNTSTEERYVCLSYCWGGKENFFTNLANIESLKASIPWDKLPQTFRDAISITRGLGIRYLWVDSLCIIQDSPEDWAKESVRMADVYGGAFLTLAAAHGADVHVGLIRQVNTNKPQFPLQDNPLYSRAWALQERILSTRLLIFGSDQMYWECQHTQQGEDGKELKVAISYRMPLKPSIRDWSIIVRDYSSRSLTNEMDKLPAISGLAEVYRQATNHVYVAGLWRETLIENLLWKQAHWLYGNRVEPSVPMQYRAPSWSWASINGNLMFHMLPRNPSYLTQSAEVLGTYLDASPNVVGAPKADWLCLRGPVLKGRIKSENILLHGGGLLLHWFDVPEDRIRGPGLESLWCLLVCATNSNCYYEGHGLILVKSDDANGNIFRRVGYFRAAPGQKSQKPIWKTRFEDCGDSAIFII